LRAEQTARGAGYDFAHDLVRGAAYRRLSTPRRRWIHGRIARVLTAATASDATLHGDVAHHATLAGEHELAARASLAAAEGALRMFASEEAARLAESGILHAERLPREARVSLTIALLGIEVRSGRWLGRSDALRAALSRVVVEAEGAGMHADSANGFHILSMLHREHGDVGGALDATMRAAAAARETDELTRARQLCDTARCLALIERDMPAARALLDEAAPLLSAPGEELAWNWALGLMRCYEGSDEGEPLLERALVLARRAQARWEEFECLMRLAQLEIDRGNPLAALTWGRELAPVAAKMTEGSEGAAAEAVDALARVACCYEGADARLESAVARLREIDAKGMLAYVLSAAAEIDGAAGRLDRAEARAKEALVAAEAVRRRSLVALARGQLADIALARGDRASARAHVDAVVADCASPLAVSARARARIDRVTTALTSP
jgi:hypothetical protein